MILAVGGGSVCDYCKAVAGSAYCEHDPWEYYFNNFGEMTCRWIPVGCVLTMAGAGSEMDSQSLGMDVVVQDKEGNEIDMRQNFDDEETGFDMRDVAGTENVVQESELLNDYNIKDADAGFDDPSVLEDDNSGSEAPASSDEVDF